MSGFVLKIPGVKFTDKTLPVYGAVNDPILTSGSLMLVDVSKIDGGVPANGQAIENLAQRQARILTGEESSVIFNSAIADATQSKLQRTAKGGIYFANKPNTIRNPYPANMAWISSVGGAKNHMMRHWKTSDKTENHSFFISLWIDLVVGPENSSASFSQLTNASNHNTSRVYRIERATGAQPSRLRMALQTFEYGSSDPTDANTVFHLYNAGKVGLNSYKLEERKAESTIFYRFYAEDLTVSGSTFDQVNALDKQLYDEAFAVGGKFYNDSYTAPAALFT